MNSSVDPIPSYLRATRKAAALVAEARIRSDEREKASNERFNIFKILLKEDDEVRLHTRFLHALLNPLGPHDCGRIFLKLFFEILQTRRSKDHEEASINWRFPSGDESWQVAKEAARNSGYGQIDLLLTHPEFGIAIENKIHAREQDKQLESYGDYLAERHPNASHLICLTKDGKQSSTHGKYKYARISYREHILPWLEECLKACVHKRTLFLALTQYQKVVKELLGEILENETMKPVIEYVASHPEIIRSWTELGRAVEEAKAEFFDRLAVAIMADLKRDFEPVLRSDMTDGRFGKDQYGNIFVDMRGNHPLKLAPFRVCIERDTDDDALVVGVYNPKKEELQREPNASLIAKMLVSFTKCSKDKSWEIVGPNEPWPLGWRYLLIGLDNAGTAELMEEPFFPLVSRLCAQIREYIVCLEQLYKNAKSESRAA